MKRILLLAKEKSENYKKAVEACGAICEIYESGYDLSYDSLILCGGSDINPKYYNQEINGSRGIDDERDKKELAYLKEFIKTGKPILGICRGHQLLNVALGGTLYQDINSKKSHMQINKTDNCHMVKAEKGSIFEKLYCSTFYTNSSHHQAIEKLGNGLIPTLYANEIIEGCEHLSKPYITVQFHPERMCLDFKNDKNVDGLKIFEYFISLT